MSKRRAARAVALQGQRAAIVASLPPGAVVINRDHFQGNEPISIFDNWNFFQTPMTLPDGPRGPNAIVEACIAAVSQTVGQLPALHYRRGDDGGKEVVETSAASRVLRRPNQYQTSAVFFSNLLRREYFCGDAYAVADRNNRFEVDALHLLPDASPVVDPFDGEIYYNLQAADTTGGALDTRRWRPARDVLHLCLYSSPWNPLKGLTPLAAAALSAGILTDANRHEAAFFKNMSRPSGVLETAERLTKIQMDELRVAWGKHSKDGATGGTPVLSSGLSWKPLTMTATDAQVLELSRWQAVQICSAFRVPPSVVGLVDSMTYSNVESMNRYWLAHGLQFVLEHLEQSLDWLFQLSGNRKRPGDEWIEFDTTEFLRTDLKTQFEALQAGINAGVLSPNEARRAQDLPAVEFGDEPRMQAQQVPLSAWYKPSPAAASAASADAAPGGKPASNPAGATAANDPGVKDPDDDADEEDDDAASKAIGELIARAYTDARAAIVAAKAEAESGVSS